jgi:hypothetical protein
MNTLLAILTISLAPHAANACSLETTTGVDYGGAAYNCEAILQGTVQSCNPAGNMWVCKCAMNCTEQGNGPGQRYTTTTGTDYGHAAQNCEMILQGQTSNCHPDGNMWVCGCYY